MRREAGKELVPKPAQTQTLNEIEGNEREQGGELVLQAQPPSVTAVVAAARAELVPAPGAVPAFVVVAVAAASAIAAAASLAASVAASSLRADPPE